MSLRERYRTIQRESVRETEIKIESVRSTVGERQKKKEQRRECERERVCV